MTRKQLYDLIWEKSISGAAKSFNCTPAGIQKCCKSNGIPLPSNRYWGLKHSSQDVSSEVIPLEGDPDFVVSLCTGIRNDEISCISNLIKSASSEQTDNTESLVEYLMETDILSFLPDQDRKNVLL
ncbi:MAG: hypothetical protein VZT48_05125 [Bulleidia sp.]|nr:hypothetical protein [Bulleidia sp.]